MIITQLDLDDLERFIESHREDFKHLGEDSYTPISIDDTEYFANHPYLLFPLGYDDYRAIRMSEDSLSEGKVRSIGFERLIQEELLVFPFESFFRTTKSGEWHWFEGITHFRHDGANTIDKKYPFYFHFVGSGNRAFFPTINQLFSKLEHIKHTPDPTLHSILFPSIWTPKIQLQQKYLLESIAKDLIKQIFIGEKELRAYHWRELEEIVAELLISKGLEVLITPRSKDGGRDVIARGELIPGDPSTIAVEVKNKSVVGLHDVQRALKANEDFPSLLIATSGVFSAGVVSEKLRERHQFRLLLKDGVALRQWIDIYGTLQGWAQKNR